MSDAVVNGFCAVGFHDTLFSRSLALASGLLRASSLGQMRKWNAPAERRTQYRRIKTDGVHYCEQLGFHGWGHVGSACLFNLFRRG
jgi:hypothetical protein